MLRMGFGLVFAGLVAAAQAAQPGEDFSVSRLDLLTTQFVHSGTDSLPYYRFNASVELIRSPDTTPIESAFGNSSQLPSIAKPQQETFQEINSHWHQTYDGDHFSLPRLLRVEFKVEQLNIALRPHSVSINGERFKVTFLPRSALIEEGRLKIILQPHSASMLWNKAF